MSNQIYKVGDKVRLLHIDFDCKGSLTESNIGDVLTITKIFKEDEYEDEVYICDNNKYMANFPEDALELVEPSEQNTFDLRNTKIRISDEEESKRVQKRLFELGCEWVGTEKTLEWYGKDVLEINENLKLINDSDNFETSKFDREIQISDLFNDKKLIDSKMDFDKLKDFDKKNLLEGKKKAEEDKATYELEEARKVYTDLVNKKEEQQRIIKSANEMIKELDEKLRIFKK